ncbi:hypothetical protein HNP29_000439 [Pseudomonas alcaligenes]|nr:hypothetical protein [Pseudomonas alcaligenes]
MSEELKPCPFCDGPAEYDHDDNGYVWLRCRNCGVSTDTATHGNTDARVKLAVMWNRRATPPAAQVQGEQLERERREIVGTIIASELRLMVYLLREISEAGWATPVSKFAEEIEKRLAGYEEAKEHARSVNPPHPLAALSAPPAADMTDAYVGAREDVAIWKRRALEAEEKVRVLDQRIDQLVLDAQGETRMGEPRIAPPAAGVPEGWKLVPVAPTPEMLEAGDGYLGTPATYKTMLSAAPQPPHSMPITAEFSQFLSAVMDAAGLVRHGRRSKELSEYLGQQCMKYRAGFAPTPPASEHQQAVVMPERKQFQDPDSFATMPEWYARQHIEASAHNACLDELLRLNPHLAGVNQGVTTEAGNGGDA